MGSGNTDTLRENWGHLVFTVSQVGMMPEKRDVAMWGFTKKTTSAKLLGSLTSFLEHDNIPWELVQSSVRKWENWVPQKFC